MIYLAGPIDAVSHSDAANWRESAAQLLGQENLGAFNPYGAFFLPIPWSKSQAHLVNAVNNFAIQRCDGVLAYLPSNKSTFGTIREIEMTQTVGIPLVVVSDWLVKHISAIDLNVEITIFDGVQRLVSLVKRHL